jgi:Fe2+ or Zn2+ uptake regulation protein
MQFRPLIEIIVKDLISLASKGDLMIKNKSAELLAKIGIDLDSSQMMVFKAVLEAAGGTSKQVTYQDVVDILKKTSGKKYSKAYIYRHFSSLEEDGFIVVDAIQRPQRYSVSEPFLSGAVKRKSQQAVSQLLKKRQALTTQLNLLETANPEDVAITAYNRLIGITSLGVSTIIEGIENVRSTVIREFADGAKKGDHVRVLAPASTIADGLGQGGMTELRIMQSASKGVKVHGMLTPLYQSNMTTELIADFLKAISGPFIEAVNTGNVKVKLAREPVQTYRMVSLNNEKMLLYLTHAKDSDAAVLIHRGNNAGLIDDAVSTFDRLWENGVDVVDIVTKMIGSDKK